MDLDRQSGVTTLNKVKGWLSSPIFEGDEEKTRLARIGNTIVLAVIAVLGVYTFARPKLFLENTEAAIANTILLLLLISQLFVIRRGWVRAAALMLTALVWLNLTVQIWLFGGIRDAAFAAYLLIILVASLVLGWRAATLFLLLSILAGLGMAHAEAVGTLPFEPDGPYALWLDHSLNFVIATILVTVMVTDLNRILDRVRRNEQNLAERNCELLTIQTLMETQIAERERTQLKLQASEKLYRQTVDNSPNPIFSVNRSGRILTWNPACESLFQYGHERIGQAYNDILWDDAVDLTVKNWLHEVFEQERSLSGVQITYRCKNGAPRTTVSRLYPAFNPEGQVEACIFANTDITERVRMEVALRESEEKYRQLVKHAPAGIYELDLINRRFTAVNDIMCEYSGYSKDEFLSLSPHQLLAEDSREQFLAQSEKLQAGEEVPETVEYKIKSKDGQVFWVLINTRVVNENGQPVRATVIAHDITERKQAEEELKQSEKWLKILFEYAPDAYYLSDLKGTFIDGNRAAEKAVGYKREELIGKNFLKLKLLSPRQIPNAAGLLAKNVFGKPTGPDEFILSRKDGSQVIMEISTYPVKHNRQTVVLGIARDITERKQTERELERHRYHLEELVTARTAELTKLNQKLQREIGERKRAEASLRQRAAELATMLEVSQAVSSTLNLEEILAIIAKQMVMALGVAGCTLSRWDKATNVVVTWIEWRRLEPETADEPGLIYNLDDFPATRAVLKTKQPATILVNDPAADPAEAAHMRQVNTAGLLMLPLATNERVIGLVELDDFKERGFTEAQIQLGQALADQAAVAIEKARLYTETQKQLKEQTALRQAITSISSTLDLETVLSQVAEQMALAIDVTSAYFGSFESETMTSAILAEFLSPQAAPQERISDLKATYDLVHDFPGTDEFLEAGQPVVLHLDSPNLPEVEAAHLQAFGVQTKLFIPLKRGEEILGYAELWESRRRREFTPEEISLCQAIARHGAIAIENARLYAQAQQEITERKRAEAQVRASLKEKEVLLQEIHHRVKNNLQIISSLLHLHAGYINDQQALEIFQDSQNRVRSMALIHEKLYRSSNLAQIDFAEYVRDLTDYLFRAQKANLQGIDLNIQTDTIFLDIDAAIPCGLILNELVSNSLKHAFPIGWQGEICINLVFENDQRVILKVRDDGVGFPPDLDFRETDSLGLKLVDTLVSQLNGEIELDSSYGTNFKIIFNLSA